MSDYQTDERMALKLRAVPLPEDLTGKSVLDVGCEGAWWCRLARDRGASRVLGLDRGREVRGRGWVDLVAENREDPANAGIEFERINLGEQWMQFGRFDVVLCMSMYHHVYGQCGDHRAIWRWLWEHTAPGGTLLWEGPLDTRDSVAVRAVASLRSHDYRREAILAAAGEFFNVEHIGPALHEPYREVLRCTPH